MTNFNKSMKDSENHWTKEARHNKTKYCILGMLQLILIICRFCVCEFIYLLQCICNLWINTHGAFMVIFVDTCKAMKHLSHCEAPNVHNAICDGTKGCWGLLASILQSFWVQEGHDVPYGENMCLVRFVQAWLTMLLVVSSTVMNRQIGWQKCGKMRGSQELNSVLSLGIVVQVC